MRKVELLPTRDCEAGYGPETAAAHLLFLTVKSDLLDFIIYAY